MTPGKPKLLIAGGGHADIPLIKAGQALGFHVITSGNRPSDLGHAVSDETCLADFSDRHAMMELARSQKIDAICSSCNDFAALSSAWVAEQLGLPGHDSFAVAQVIHHKDRFKALCARAGVSTPRAVGLSPGDDAVSKIGDLRLPLIVKPVDLTGGKGISTARSQSDIAPAIEKAFAMTRASRIVVEEFIEGTRHGLTSFLRAGRVVFSFMDNEHYFKNPFMVSAASAPSIAPREAAAAVVASIEKLAADLSLADGIVHVQFIYRDGEAFIIEICRRPPGDLYIEFVKHATGLDYPDLLVRNAAGLDTSHARQQECRGFFTRHCVMPDRTGTIVDCAIDDEVKSKVIDQMMWWRPGDSVTDIMTHKLGIMFFSFGSMDEMRAVTDRLPQLVHPVFAG